MTVNIYCITDTKKILFSGFGCLIYQQQIDLCNKRKLIQTKFLQQIKSSTLNFSKLDNRLSVKSFARNTIAITSLYITLDS